jgi:hypothetical protein
MGLRPFRRGRDRLPCPIDVVFGGPGWWVMCDAPAFARTAISQGPAVLSAQPP